MKVLFRRASGPMCGEAMWRWSRITIPRYFYTNHVDNATYRYLGCMRYYVLDKNSRLRPVFTPSTWGRTSLRICPQVSSKAVHQLLSGRAVHQYLLGVPRYKQNTHNHSPRRNHLLLQRAHPECWLSEAFSPIPGSPYNCVLLDRKDREEFYRVIQPQGQSPRGWTSMCILPLWNSVTL